MEHSFIDQYSSLQSLIHRLNPGIKAASFIVFILFIAFTGPASFLTFALYGLLIFILIILSGIPPGFILKRSLVVIPFVLVIAAFNISRSGLLIFWNVFIKSYLSVLCLILLTSTTKFPALLRAFEDFKVPKLFIMISSFMYRYIFVTMDELMRMKQAKDSRTVNPSGFFNFKVLANLVGNLFIRTYERGERVYLAMCARGFDGDIKTLRRCKLTLKDVIFFTVVLSALGLIRFRRGL